MPRYFKVWKDTSKQEWRCGYTTTIEGKDEGRGNEGRRGGEGGKEKEVSEMEELGREACIIYIIRRIALVSHLDLSCCC